MSNKNRKPLLALIVGLITAVGVGLTAAPVAAGTGTCVGLVAKVTGPTSTVLSWGSGKIPLVVTTNASKGYKLTVTVTGVKNGTLIGVKDINITLTSTAATGTTISTPPTATASATMRTPLTGDRITVNLSTWQPLGSPTVTIKYSLTPYPGTPCP